jgi:hypothetical protein
MPSPTAPGCSACASTPCGCESDVKRALDALDDLLTAGLDSVSNEDLDAVDAWANNIQLDIARHRRLQGGRRG